MYNVQVFDQYVNFISMEDFFFTVRHQNRDAISYYSEYPSNHWDDRLVKTEEWKKITLYFDRLSNDATAL